MAVQPYPQLPTVFTAGDSLAIRLSLSDFPADDGWTVTYTLLVPGAAEALTVGPSVADGTVHTLSASPADTAEWPAGLYAWQLQASKGADATLQVFTCGTGSIQIKAALAAGVDPRTHEEKCLAAITAVIEGRVADPIVEYRIGDREAKRIPMLELLKLKGYYQAAVRRQRGESPFRVIPVRFQGGRFRV